MRETTAPELVQGCAEQRGPGPTIVPAKAWHPDGYWRCGVFASEARAQFWAAKIETGIVEAIPKRME